MVRAFGGLTTVVWSLNRALDFEVVGQIRPNEAQRNTAKAVNIAKLIGNWVGADMYTELVIKA